MAPNCGGQCRMHVSQLMQIDMSILSGAFCHFGLRSRLSSRSARDPAAIGPPPYSVAPGATLTRGSRSDWTGAPMRDERQFTPQGRQRKQQLLDCAARLFAERGYDDTRVIDIVREAGVAKGLFYWYFDNKEQLFADLADEIRLRLRRSQGEAMDPSADPLTRIRQGAEASVRFMAINAPFFALLEVESVDRQFVDVLRKGTEVHVTDVANLIREGVDAGLVRDDDPVLLARGVVGVVGLYSHFHRTGRSTVPITELAAFVGRFVVRSLAADDEIALAAQKQETRSTRATTAIAPGGRG